MRSPLSPHTNFPVTFFLELEGGFCFVLWLPNARAYLPRGGLLPILALALPHGLILAAVVVGS